MLKDYAKRHKLYFDYGKVDYLVEFAGTTMNISNELLFVESKDARNQGLTELKAQHLEESVLNKVKVLVFAVLNGVGRITRQQLADFYEVSVETIDSNYERHKDEFEIDGVEVLRGNALKDGKRIMRLPSKSSQETIYTPAGVLRMGFILRESQVAKAVRTAVIVIVQNVGQQQMNSELVLQGLVQTYPIISSFVEGSKVKISAPFSRYWEKMKASLSRNYPNGGIPDMTKDDIRKNIQFLSGYTDFFKLQGKKELTYELSSSIRAKYPDLITDIFSFQNGNNIIKSTVMFQFDNLIIDVDYVESCIGRGYIQIAKESLKIDNAYLIFVAPFGATSYAEDYIRKRLVSDYKGYVGVLTVKDLADFLHIQALSNRKLGTLKGGISTDFKKLSTYSFPEPPEIYEQLQIDGI